MAKKDSGILEIIAIGAILLSIFKRILKSKAIVLSEEIGGEDNTCKYVVHKPLSTANLTPANLLGKNYCYRGDLSVMDFSKGSGDPYAEDQAEAYTEMKQEEALRAINKSYIQFRLINSTSDTITNKILDTTQDSYIVDGTDDSTTLNIPIASAASGVSTYGFTANWSESSGASGYYLDIATDSAFTSFLPGYENKDVGNVLSYSITGLSSETSYYYRIRSYNDTRISNDSNIITQETLTKVTDEDGNEYDVVTIGSLQWLTSNLKTTKYNDGTAIPNQTENSYNDWFLPSLNEFALMETNLYDKGVGGFTEAVYYWTSSESSANRAYSRRISDGNTNFDLKSTLLYVRACRKFTAVTGAYSLRDVGQAGGLIFYEDDQGDGTSIYYEAAPSDQSEAHAWSNVTNSSIGTTSTAIGEGQNNTNEIIAQAGHTDSAAKLCDDLDIGGWVNDTTGAYCWYDNDISYKSPYGALYNWYAINTGKLAPAGWRVATKDDWDALIAALGGELLAGGAMKETGTDHWNSPNTGATDSAGLACVGSGYRLNHGTFASLKENALLWTATEDSPDYTAHYIALYDTSKQAVSLNITFDYGFSVRCVRDV